MRLLLDTHAILWHFERNPLLSAEASAAIKNPQNDIFVSVVSLWELAIKTSLGKLKLPKSVSGIAAELRDGGAAIIRISEEHAMATESLPWHHRDPFDRMLIAQALQENLALVTCDSAFAHYDVPRVW